MIGRTILYNKIVLAPYSLNQTKLFIAKLFYCGNEDGARPACRSGRPALTGRQAHIEKLVNRRRDEDNFEHYEYHVSYI